MPPLAVRVQVAERQFGERFCYSGSAARSDLKGAKKLAWLLGMLFMPDDALPARIGELLEVQPNPPPPHALDHDPALILRPYNPRIKDVASRYTPHAHDPDALIYREKADHGQKTTGRRPGAERTITTKGSDIGLKTKFARLEKPRKPRTTIQPRGFPKTSRPFPKGRKFDAR